MSEALLVIGFDEIVSNKYLPLIGEAIRNNCIKNYGILDLLSAKEDIENRLIHCDVKPDTVMYLDNVNQDETIWSAEEQFGPLIDSFAKKHGRIKVYIATEVKSHARYMQYCIEKGYDSLTEKPILAPFENGMFAPSKIWPETQRLFQSSMEHHHAKHSIMSLSRYHPIYNDKAIFELKQRATTYRTPISSIHIRHAGGVWNAHPEFFTREDHPYKYGYGMLMHGAYHYLDLVAQCLDINKSLFPDEKLRLEVRSFAAFPKDQAVRIGLQIRGKICDYADQYDMGAIPFGETDVVASLRLYKADKGETITLGTVVMEQTTPSIRTWSEIPEGLYNKNGRISSVDFEAQLSTIYSVKVHCYDVPVKEKTTLDRIDAKARIITRANASLLSAENYVEESEYSGLFHSESNKKLMYSWLCGCEDRSDFCAHLGVMKLLSILSVSLYESNGYAEIEY